MTKTLTEQWRKHNLKYKQNYYLLLEDGGEDIQPFMGGFFVSESNEVKEVLAPVPSYDEWKELDDELKELATKNDTLAMENGRLKERLAIAIKALKETKEKLLHVELSGLDGDNRQKMYDLMFTDGVIDKALKEMEGVK